MQLCNRQKFKKFKMEEFKQVIVEGKSVTGIQHDGTKKNIGSADTQIGAYLLAIHYQNYLTKQILEQNNAINEHKMSQLQDKMSQLQDKIDCIFDYLVAKKHFEEAQNSQSEFKKCK